jgi:hypothetical protein
MKISVRIDSPAANAQLRRWGGQFRARVQKSVAMALARESRMLKEDLRSHVGGQLHVARKAFLKSFTTRILDKDTQRLPALQVFSRIPWAGIHEHGGRINKRVLIPLHGRVGRKRFKAQVDQLIRGGNAYFIRNAKGQVILMAENIREHDQALAGFKRRYRKAEGVKRIKRGADVPIAVLVPSVTLKKRLNIQRLVEQRLPRLVREIDKGLAGLD